MLGLFKKKVLSIVAPVEGEIVPLEEVEDEVFSAKLAGDGVAIKPQGDHFVAPCDGIVNKIFPTNHAFSIRSGKVEVMVHIGLDTVNLKGEGFKRLIEEGVTVKAGEAVIKVDLPYLKKYAKDTITPIVILEGSDNGVTPHFGSVKTNDIIMEVK
jgi:PTS system glucose-specific IIA component